MKHRTEFAKLLLEAMSEMKMGSQVVSNATRELLLDSKTDVPKKTIDGWITNGRNPREWEPVILVAAALGRNASQVDELLKAAGKGKLTVAELLLRAKTNNNDIYKLIEIRWADDVRQAQELPFPVPATPEERPRQAAHRRWPMKTLGVLLLVVVVVGAVIANNHPVVAVNELRIVAQQSGNVFLKTGGPNSKVLTDVPKLGEDRTIQAGELITVSYTVQNTSKTSVVALSLNMACRGPEADIKKWDAEHCDFTQKDEVPIEPGKTFEFKDSRRFLTPGVYFIVPILKREEPVSNPWSGGLGYAEMLFFTVVR